MSSGTHTGMGQIKGSQFRAGDVKGERSVNNIYNAITQNNSFIKGSHKYYVYLVEQNKAHLSLPNKDRIAI